MRGYTKWIRCLSFLLSEITMSRYYNYIAYLSISQNWLLDSILEAYFQVKTI